MFMTNPVLGVGSGTFMAKHGIDTHNNYLKMLSEMGLLGIGIYLYLYYIAFKNGWRLYKENESYELKGLGLGFSMCVLSNMICNATHDSWTYTNLMSYYWILLGLVVSCRAMGDAGIGIGNTEEKDRAEIVRE